MDSNRIDSHKLMFHPARVARWLASEGKENYVSVYPLYAEISLSRICNHYCTFCALDFLEDGRKPFLRTELIHKLIPEMSNLGVKSIMYGGEGEPLMHPEAAEIVNLTGDCNIDTALTTNGALLSDKIVDSILENPNSFHYLKWIKISLNAGSSNTYVKIHRSPKEDFSKVINNIKYLMKRKRDLAHPVTVGIQILLLPENELEIEVLAQVAKDIGVDYFVVKPYSHHPKSKTQEYKDIKYNKSDMIDLQKYLLTLNSNSFKTIFRIEAINNWNKGNENRGYSRCYALPFWTYINTQGVVWGCSSWLEDKKFYYGNVYIKTFEEIWKGKLRQRSLKWVEDKLDVNQYCRVNCRMNEINKYLWELKNPSKHINFI